MHTCFSHDSVITPKELIFYAKKRGLDGVAITDHDRIDGALKMAKKKDILIIPGIEVSSIKGHVMGLNLYESIPKKLSASETVDKIHELGGVAVACHPITFFRESLGRHTNSKFDAVEVINASAIPFKYSVKGGKKLALLLQKPQIGGSDAHYAPEIGCAFTIVEAEADIEEIFKALKKGLCRPFGMAIPIKKRLRREAFSLKKKIASMEIF